MRMLIASDLHGSSESLEILLARTEELKPDRVVLLGDILYHGPRNKLPFSYGPGSMPDNFVRLMDMVPLTAVRGNCDAEVDLLVLPFPLPDNAWLVDGDIEIYASHGHHLPEMPPMRGFKEGTVFLRGHTHVPRAEEVGGYHFWNPGSITLPKQGFPRSYALYENGHFKVLSLEGDIIVEENLRA